MLLVGVDVHLVLAWCCLYILACWQNYYRKKKISWAWIGHVPRKNDVYTFLMKKGSYSNHCRRR